MDINNRDNDFSDNFHQNSVFLLGSNSEENINYIHTLTPIYWKVWKDIFLGYFLLIVTLLIINNFSNQYEIISSMMVIILGSVFVGFWIHFLSLFMHEAGHRNLANNKWNDLLANFCLCWIFGVNIKDYRGTHFQHHRLLGTVNDPENSYFNSLDLLFIVKTLFGIHALKIIFERNNKWRIQARSATRIRQSIPMKNYKKLYMLSITVFIHLAIVMVMYYFQFKILALTWILGLFMFFPFFNSIRQILEHRNFTSDSSVNYSLTPHGAYTRIFDNKLFSFLFGSAGFNRHLLHHWFPHVSYTRFGELELYLSSTNLSYLIHSRKSNYFSVLSKLFKI